MVCHEWLRIHAAWLIMNISSVLVVAVVVGAVFQSKIMQLYFKATIRPHAGHDYQVIISLKFHCQKHFIFRTNKHCTKIKLLSSCCGTHRATQFWFFVNIFLSISIIVLYLYYLHPLCRSLNILSDNWMNVS